MVILLPARIGACNFRVPFQSMSLSAVSYVVRLWLIAVRIDNLALASAGLVSAVLCGLWGWCENAGSGARKLWGRVRFLGVTERGKVDIVRQVYSETDR